MVNKELKRLRRTELLELLLLQTKEMERLKEQLEKAEAELEDRRLKVAAIGNLADAVVEINGVMAAAQAAADHYLENIKQMEEEARIRLEQVKATTGLDGQPTPEE